MSTRETHESAHEHEAEQTATRAAPGGHHCGCTCGACAHRLQAGLQPLHESVRSPFAHALGANLDAVRVKEDTAATRMHAAAFTSGDTITFAPGRYRPDTAAGRHLIAHELTHTLQQRSNPPVGITAAPRGRIQRNDETPIDEVAIAVAVARITAAIAVDDVEGAVDPLRKRSLDERIVIRERVIANLSIKLERWFVERTRTPPPTGADAVLSALVSSPLLGAASRLPPAHAKTAEEGLRLVWRAAPLIDRLEVYDEGTREIEQAQLDTIRGASRDERIQAQAPANKDRLTKVLGNLDEREEYDARKLLDVDHTHALETANRMLDRDDDDVLFDAILDLDIRSRIQFVMKDHYSTIYHRFYAWQLIIIKNMARGTEAESLIQRLRLATQDRRDDQESVSSVIDRAVELLKERRELQGVVGVLTGEAREIAERRLRELETLDRFMSFERTSDGSLRPQTFLGLVSGARDDPAKFANDAARFAEFIADPVKAKRFAFEVAKQRILLADGDTDAMRLAILQLHAPPPQVAPGAPPPTEMEQQRADEAFRTELLKDEAVGEVVSRIPNAIPRNQVIRAVEGDRFWEQLMQFSNATEGGRYGEVFHITYLIAKNPGWNARLEYTKTERGLQAAMNPINHLPSTPRRIVDWMLLNPGHLPLIDILKFMDDEKQLKIVFDDIGEADRAKLRLGWYLTEHPPIGAPSPKDLEAITFYQEVKTHLTSSQTGLTFLPDRLHTFDDKAFITVMATGLGTEPTAEELTSGEGRYRAALLWHDVQQQRLSLDRGIAAEYTETDETMAAAAREFDALWQQVKESGTLSTIDFYALASLHRTFEGRAEEFSDASRSISEMAAMIAATVAGIIVVVATGGAATPGVIALAAAAGGTTRIVTREMFGADYYNAMSSEGAKDILLGSVDGALSVVSAGLAARGTQLLGLSGGALTRNAAKVAGEVAEEAARPLGRRVLAGSVEAAIDGAFSGSVSEAFGAMVDERTWRRGIMDGLARVGAAALLGGLTGAVGGAVIGGAMPVLGAGASRLWKAVARRGVESTLERAGMKTALEEARAFAKLGKVDDVNRIAAELEANLTGEEIMWLRQHLGEEMRSVMKHPPGTVLPDGNSKAATLLGESSTTRVPTGEHLEAELDVVRKSQPQPSREPGYLDEVDLGNGHTWRRKKDGTWCRFSSASLCGTDILNAPPLSEGAKRQARIEAAKEALQNEQAELIKVGEQHEQFNALVDRLAARKKAGETIDLASLTDAEKKTINSIQYMDFETATLKDLQALRGRELKTQIQLALDDIRKAELHLADVRQSHYDKLRQRSPGTTVRDRIIKAAKGKDFVSGLPPVSGALECDHIVPLREIADMPGFKRLDFDTQVKIANFEDNLKGVDALVNSHRQDKSWRAQFGKRDQYTQKQLEKIIEHEDDMRKKIQEQIDEGLKKAGKPTGPP